MHRQQIKIIFYFHALGEKLDSEVALGQSIEPVPATDDEAPIVEGQPIDMPEATVSEFGDDRVDCDLTSKPCGVEPVDVSAQREAIPPYEAEAPARFTWAEYARFSQLTTLGRARSSIARTLKRESGERFSLGRVADDAPAMAIASLPAGHRGGRSHGLSCNFLITPAGSKRFPGP